MIFATSRQGGFRSAPCWCCPFFALCYMAGPVQARTQSQLPSETQNEIQNESLNEQQSNREQAVAFLHRYSLGYGLLYACEKSRLPAFMFDYLPPDELTMESAGNVSPQLLKLIVDMQDDPALYERTCDVAGTMAQHFSVPEMSNDLLEGLRSLDQQGDGRNAFENGVYFRIRGYDPGFERYAAHWHRVLEAGELAQR